MYYITVISICSVAHMKAHNASVYMADCKIPGMDFAYRPLFPRLRRNTGDILAARRIFDGRGRINKNYIYIPTRRYHNPNVSTRVVAPLQKLSIPPALLLRVFQGGVPAKMISFPRPFFHTRVQVLQFYLSLIQIFIRLRSTNG